MMLEILAGPIVGGVIGYITNSLAIQMLFRPYKAVMIGKWRLPFTPGLIPKEQERIAESIGSVVSGELLNNTVVTKALTSPQMLDRISGWFDRVWQRAENSTSTLRDKLYQISDPDLMDGLIQDANQEIAILIGDKLKHFQMGEEIARQCLQNLRNKYLNEFSLKSMMAHILDDDMIDSLAESLGRHINQLVSDNSRQIVGKFMNLEVDKFLDIPIIELACRYQDRKDIFRQALLDGYCGMIHKELQKILQAVNISDIVRERINSYDMAEMEKLLKSIMKKELRAIVWLGALLGFLMGFITSWLALG